MPGPFCVVCHGGVTEASFLHLKEGRKLKGWSPWTLWVCKSAVCAVCLTYTLSVCVAAVLSGCELHAWEPNFYIDRESDLDS